LPQSGKAQARAGISSQITTTSLGCDLFFCAYRFATHQRLPLEGKLSPKVTDEVEKMASLTTSSASRCSAPSPRGEGFDTQKPGSFPSPNGYFQPLLWRDPSTALGMTDLENAPRSPHQRVTRGFSGSGQIQVLDTKCTKSQPSEAVVIWKGEANARLSIGVYANASVCCALRRAWRFLFHKRKRKRGSQSFPAGGNDKLASCLRNPSSTASGPPSPRGKAFFCRKTVDKPHQIC